MTGKNIICFGSESWSYNGFQQTAMRLLARDNRVLYVNALGTRRVALTFSELPVYFKRARRLFQKSIDQSSNAMVYNARIIPLVYNHLIGKINRIIVQKQFLGLIYKFDFKNYILWIGTPTAAFLLDIFDPILVVYNPVDRYYAFPFVNSAKVREYERMIAGKADIVICTSEAIKNDLSPYNDHCFTVTHGVDCHHFRSALSVENVPEDIGGIPKPIIGFYGGLSERVNYELIQDVAIHYPGASVVLIGEGKGNFGTLEKLANVHFLGYRGFEFLPLYLKQFNVCLIPYRVNELMAGVDPVKLREYLSLGKAVVSVDLPEVRKLGDLVYTAENEGDFVVKVGKALEENNSVLVERRIEEAKKNDWDIKIAEICEIVEDSLERRGSLF